MSKVFYGSKLGSIFNLIIVIAFSIAGILKLSMGNLLGLVSLFVALLFLIKALWRMSTPYIEILDEKILFNQSITKQEEIEFCAIDVIEYDELNNKFEILMKDDNSKEMHLYSIRVKQRENFKKAILELDVSKVKEYEEGFDVSEL
jgi:hypothetical protein